MSDYEYTITTMKSWPETMEELGNQMRLWGVSDWTINNPQGALLRSADQTVQQRTVKLTYTKTGRSVTLMMAKQRRAVDNLRVLYLAVEAMRLNERRGISDVIESAYLQLAAPAAELDPYELLEIRSGASIEVAEAAYKAKVREAHPDRGGSPQRMTQLNEAIDQIRKGAK